MELRQVAKKSAKKAAKKAAAKHAAKHAAKQAGKQGKDTRRAYEHLGRVQSLAAHMSTADSEGAKTLAGYAEQALRAGASKDAAELLRAAEHHLFGTLALVQSPDESVSSDLLGSVREEYEHLVQRAEDHGSCDGAPRPVAALFRAMQKSAAAALRAGSFRAALEFARGAEALTHADFARLLPSGVTDRKRIPAK